MATDDELKAIADSALENSIENQSLTISPGSKSVSRTPARDSFAIRHFCSMGLLAPLEPGEAAKSSLGALMMPR
jgi:hypothetical protein